MEGPDREMVIVDRFIRTRPEVTCERQMADASLQNTYWRLDVVDGMDFPSDLATREPHLMLERTDGNNYRATVGCNRMRGAYTLDGAQVSFLPAASTMMACPEPLDTLERQFSLADGTVGVLEDGSPAFPDLVLGTWTCDGYFVGEGGNATTGVWIISRQTFVFNDGATVVTHGTEIADIGQPNLRPVTGATGDFADIGGGLIQTTLGFNDFWGLSATYVFESPKMDTAKPRDATFHIDGYRSAPVDEDDHLEWDSGAPVGPIFEDRMTPST